MPRIISQRELRNDSAAVLRDVQAGATFVVTRNGTPVAELRPISPHRFVARERLVEDFRRLPAFDAARFRRDVDDVVDQSFGQSSSG